MGKLIVLVLLVAVAVWLIRRALQPPQAKPPREGELVACARCGVHVPKSEARAAGEALYCSDEHARLGRAAR